MDLLRVVILAALSSTGLACILYASHCHSCWAAGTPWGATLCLISGERHVQQGVAEGEAYVWQQRVLLLILPRMIMQASQDGRTSGFQVACVLCSESTASSFMLPGRRATHKWILKTMCQQLGAGMVRRAYGCNCTLQDGRELHLHVTSVRLLLAS